MRGVREWTQYGLLTIFHVIFGSSKKTIGAISKLRHLARSMRSWTESTKKDYPDALLCDVFFYDSVEEAERVEAEIENLATQLKGTAQKIGVHDHQHAAGIQLMSKIYEFFGNKPPRFPMYAYTSKGPFLLEQSEWDNISTYGAEVLLKNRVLPERERLEIKGDIAIARARHSWLAWGKLRSREFLWNLLPNVVVAVAAFFLGRWLGQC